MKLVYISSLLVTWTVFKTKKVYGTYSLISTEVSNPYITQTISKSITIIFLPISSCEQIDFLG